MVHTDNPQALESESANALLRIEWKWESILITSISGYLYLTRDNIEDCDGSINDICRAAFPFDNDQYTQEIRVDGGTEQFRWTTGFYYLHQDADAHPQGFFFGGVPPTLDAPWQLETDSWALFGQGEYDINPRFTIIAGIRFTQDKKEFETENRTFGVFATPASNFTKATVL